MPTQKRSQRLKIVLDLIDREEEQERQALGQIRSQLHASDAKIEQLIAYQRQYQEDLRSTSSSVKSVRHIQTFHVFISRLGTAIEQQQQQSLLLKQKLEVQTGKWQMVYQKKKNMEEFVDRCRNEEQIEEDRKEQRQLDDATHRRPHRNI
ncbi:flagellar export protein FliJ [Hahella sp. CCB-MM4]|uniref:flagellar export protein FliJ n=1 Tax=Hahella sp. (strain CCB-MM4) TaxID=1926491 RepID=UPI000B9C53C3|nr:flagellar export protein FliJ [Hahella sp. CCB-MM4]OZG72887.1 flagellar export protein FliJ [Hahella sp. CCB-MM4]